MTVPVLVLLLSLAQAQSGPPLDPGLGLPALAGLHDRYNSQPFGDAYHAFQLRAFGGAKPFIVRSEWGARPPRTFQPHMAAVVVTIHHTKSRHGSDEESGRAAARRTQTYHMDERKLTNPDNENFDDIGYHFLVDGEGRVYEGRQLRELGAHAGGVNYGNLGVALIGDFYKETPSEAQLDGAVRLLTYLNALFRVDEDFLYPHDHWVKKAPCPGPNLKPLLPDLQKRVDANMHRLQAHLWAPRPN